MGKSRKDVFAQTEHAARASLSRIIRNSEAGWLFYAPDGTAYHILSDEAEVLEMRGQRRIQQIGRFVAEIGALPGRTFKSAIAIFGINVILGVTFGNDWLKPNGDFVNIYVLPSLILFSLFFAFFRPFLALSLRSSLMLTWQKKEAEHLRKSGRGSVPDTITKKHDRYNLFRLIRTAALTLLVIRFATMWLLTPSEVLERGFAIEAICVGIILLTSIPAKLVDKTHIRRKWFD